VTHLSEDAFARDYAMPWLRDRFPSASIERERYVTDPRGYVDAWVAVPDLEDPALIAAVEIGNDESVRDECSQAIEYASHDDRAVPYVIIPAKHAEHSAVSIFRDRGVVIIELPTAD